MITISPHLQFESASVYGKKLFVAGKSGAGKTETLKTTAAQLLQAGVPIVFIDPLSQCRDLVSQYPIVLAGGGKNAHVQLSSGNAAQLAEWCFHERVSVVLEVRTVKGVDEMSILEPFLRRFWQLASEGDIDDPHQPFALLIDEAQYYVPQQGATAISPIIIDIAKTGRHFLLTLIAASQRCASVAKDFLNMCNILIIHRVIGTDISYLCGNWMPLTATEMKAVMKRFLPGEALVMGDADLVDTGEEDVIRTRMYLSGEQREQAHVEVSTSLRALDASLLAALAATLSGDTAAAPAAPTREAAPNDLQAKYEAAVARAKMLEAKIAELEQANAELRARPPQITFSNGNGHKPAAGEDTEEYRSELAKNRAVAKQRRAFDGLKVSLKQQEPWQLDALIYLTRLELQLTVRELSRFLSQYRNLSQTTVYKNAPTWMMKKGYLRRESKEGGFVYSSTFRAKLAEDYPDLDVDALVEEVYALGSKNIRELAMGE